MAKVNSECFDFQLTKGFSAETSGGLLCLIKADKAADFIKELREEYGQCSWEIGDVVAGSKSASIKEDHEIINVKEFLLL